MVLSKCDCIRENPQFKQVFKIYPLMTTALFWNISRFEDPNFQKAALAQNYQQCFESHVYDNSKHM